MAAVEIDPTCPSRLHTRWGRYKHGCICTAVKSAILRYDKLLMAGLIKSSYVPSIGTVRRLRALAVLGYGTPSLESRSGKDKRQLSDWRSGRQELVSQENAELIARLYDALRDTPGPSALARNRAIKLGWYGPEAWALGDIDDPDEEPSIPNRLRKIGSGRPRIKVDEVEDARDLGFTDGEIAEMLCVKPASLRDVMRRKQRKADKAEVA